jgi:hypothetical protein
VAAADDPAGPRFLILAGQTRRVKKTPRRLGAGALPFPAWLPGLLVWQAVTICIRVLTAPAVRRAARQNPLSNRGETSTWTTAAGHGSSRDGEDLNTHPATARFYPYRSRVRRRDCQCRMAGHTYGKLASLSAYYRCPHNWPAPRAGVVRVTRVVRDGSLPVRPVAFRDRAGQPRR